MDHDRTGGKPQLAVVIVSANSGRWLRRCLTSVLAQAGGVKLEIIVVAGGCSDDTVSIVQCEFPSVRLIECENRGFAYANNQAALSSRAEYLLFLNPDTEIIAGTLGHLIRAMRTMPRVGVVGVRQQSAEGAVHYSIRRFPTVLRLLGEALGSERWQVRGSRSGLRELRRSRYDVEQGCDWVSGSFLLVRREALAASGLMDERFFLYYEEPDLCLRMLHGGWETRYLPIMTVLHHGGEVSMTPRLMAQHAFSGRLYLRKHVGGMRRVGSLLALALGHAVRSVPPVADRESRRANRYAFLILMGLGEAPFGDPPVEASTPR